MGSANGLLHGVDIATFADAPCMRDMRGAGIRLPDPAGTGPGTGVLVQVPDLKMCCAGEPASLVDTEGRVGRRTIGDLLSRAEETWAGINPGARNGRHRITSQHGSWRISPGRAEACCATVSSCSTTRVNCSLMTVSSPRAAFVRPTPGPGRLAGSGELGVTGAGDEAGMTIAHRIWTKLLTDTGALARASTWPASGRAFAGLACGNLRTRNRARRIPLNCGSAFPLIRGVSDAF